MSILFALLIIGIFVVFDMKILNQFQVIVPLFLLVLTIALFYIYKIKDAQRVKEYMCGEKDELKLSLFYYDISSSHKQWITIISLAFIALTIIGGM